MKKKILVVDDSALMRRVLCDIISSDESFEVTGRAINGLEALELVKKNTYDAIVLDVNMPRMNGIQFLAELKKAGLPQRVMMASTDTREGAQTTMDALELGALDFIHKPDQAYACKEGDFTQVFLNTLKGVANSRLPVFEDKSRERQRRADTDHLMGLLSRSGSRIAGSKIVAIASSTGGPKALSAVIPYLPENLDAPVVVVQHMPKGFTATLAQRLNSVSKMTVCEASEGQVLEKGHAYIAAGGLHMNIVLTPSGSYKIHYTDEPLREGVKPCANYMFESLIGSRFDQIVCCVLTGMGADGTEGIRKLKASRKTYVISQDEATSTIYGMPKAVYNAGLSDQVTGLDKVAEEISMRIGIR